MRSRAQVLAQRLTWHKAAPSVFQVVASTCSRFSFLDSCFRTAIFVHSRIKPEGRLNTSFTEIQLDRSCFPLCKWISHKVLANRNTWKGDMSWFHSRYHWEGWSKMLWKHEINFLSVLWHRRPEQSRVSLLVEKWGRLRSYLPKEDLECTNDWQRCCCSAWDR